MQCTFTAVTLCCCGCYCQCAMCGVSVLEVLSLCDCPTELLKQHGSFAFAETGAFDAHSKHLSLSVHILWYRIWGNYCAVKIMQNNLSLAIEIYTPV